MTCGPVMEGSLPSDPTEWKDYIDARFEEVKMSIHRFFRRQFPLRNRIRGIAFLCFILLMYGCGSESINSPLGGSVDGTRETEDLVPMSSIYYPMTVGSRWVYRNPDGSEWMREVTETKIFGANLYHFFSSAPPLQNTQIESLSSPVYATFLDRLVHRVNNEEINDVVWETILQSVCKKNRALHHRFSNGVWQRIRKRTQDKTALVYLYSYNTSIKGDGHSELTLFRFPLVPGQTFEAPWIKLIGNYQIVSQIHVFEATVVISGSVGNPETVVTPAGIFDDCLKIHYEAGHPSIEAIEYKMELPPRGDVPQIAMTETEQLLSLLEADIRNELTNLFISVVPKIGFETVWLAPGVGPVKIEMPNGIVELIDYDVKKGSNQSQATSGQ